MCYIWRIVDEFLTNQIAIPKTDLMLAVLIYLFIWVLTPLSTHCIGHIMTASFMFRGNQYIQLVKVLYCNGILLDDFLTNQIHQKSHVMLELQVFPLCYKRQLFNEQKSLFTLVFCRLFFLFTDLFPSVAL